MTRFLLRRLMFFVVAMIGATVVMFTLTRLGPDPRELYVPQGGFGVTKEQWEELGKRMGFDKPVVVQYFVWLGNILQGDFGESLSLMQPVNKVLAGKWGATLQLALGGWIFAVLVGVPMGVMAAVKRGTMWDYLGRGFAVFGQALPAFWTGVMAILVFSVMLNVLPAGTRPEKFDVRYYILPSVVLGWPAAAAIMRLTRSSMLEILDSEFIKFARAKGVAEWHVIWKHALKNSLIVPLTSMVFLLAGFLTGALVVEIVFSWPGVGYIVLSRAVFDNDFPLLLGGVFFYVSLYLLAALMADILYAFIDPRIRYQ